MEEIMIYQKQLYSDSFSKVKAILISSWDPLGVLAEPSVQDEYDSFVPAIFELLKKGVTSEVLSAYLQRIESDDFGLAPDRAKTQIVADMLIKNLVGDN
jgi:hypothetical protein